MFYQHNTSMYIWKPLVKFYWSHLNKFPSKFLALYNIIRSHRSAQNSTFFGCSIYEYSTIVSYMFISDKEDLYLMTLKRRGKAISYKWTLNSIYLKALHVYFWISSRGIFNLVCYRADNVSKNIYIVHSML